MVRRWLGDDEEFNALSKQNKANRGHGGTHSAGSRSTGRYKEHMVDIYMEQAPFISLHFPT